MKKKRLLSTLIICVMVFTSCLNLFAMAGCDWANTGQREYTLPDINADFKTGHLYVSLTPEYSGVNKPIVREDFVTNKMILKESVPEDELEEATKKYVIIDEIVDMTYTDDPENKFQSPTFFQMLTVYIVNQDKQSIIDAIVEFYKFDYVKTAAPFYIQYAIDLYTPNDTYYENQWGLDNDYGINADNLYDFLGPYSTQKVKVGIFERNIQSDHPDLNVIPGSFTPSSSEDTAHGTNVAGIIGAKANKKEI